jgi:hypothetical protein
MLPEGARVALVTRIEARWRANHRRSALQESLNHRLPIKQ